MGIGILFRKKGAYYLFSVLSIVALCMAGGLIIMNGKEYSVFESIQKRNEIPDFYFEFHNIRSVFLSGISPWLYFLIPVVSIPFVSYLSEERRSRFYLYAKTREGSRSYLLRRIWYAGISSAVVLAVGLGIFLVLDSCFFGLCINSEYLAADEIVSAGEEVWLLCTAVLGRLAYLSVYSTAISLLTACFVYLYNDLLVDLSLAILVNYALMSGIQRSDIWCPLILVAISGVLYVGTRKMRSEKL